MKSFFKEVLMLIKNSSPRRFAPGSGSRLSPAALAYMGDAVFELYVRTYLMESKENRPVADLHRFATELVRARGQAALLEEIMPFLTEEEVQLVRRGRNSGGRVPRGSTMGDYRHATGLETLLGALYLEGKVDRLQEIMETVFKAWQK